MTEGYRRQGSEAGGYRRQGGAGIMGKGTVTHAHSDVVGRYYRLPGNYHSSLSAEPVNCD